MGRSLPSRRFPRVLSQCILSYEKPPHHSQQWLCHSLPPPTIYKVPSWSHICLVLSLVNCSHSCGPAFEVSLPFLMLWYWALFHVPTLFCGFVCELALQLFCLFWNWGFVFGILTVPHIHIFWIQHLCQIHIVLAWAFSFFFCFVLFLYF